ncbi:hypothetical protein ACLKA7_003367 [Drosophila subpalustris]
MCTNSNNNNSNKETGARDTLSPPLSHQTLVGVHSSSASLRALYVGLEWVKVLGRELANGVETICGLAWLINDAEAGLRRATPPSPPASSTARQGRRRGWRIHPPAQT